jgi:hypothetical protein
MPDFTEELMHLNQLNAHELSEEFLRCCGSPGWVNEMMKLRPFPSAEAVFEQGNQIWWNLPREEWLNAFAAHPKIGNIIGIPLVSFSILMYCY